MKKRISMLTACMLLLTALPVSAAETESNGSVQATVLEDTAPYTFYMVPERNAVSLEELQEGDVSIRTNVYIKGSRSLPNPISSAAISYTKDSSCVYFDNSADIFAYAAEPQEASYSGGDFISEYEMPFCFGEITSSGEYAPCACRPMDASQFFDPINGSVIRSDGEGGLYFTRSYYMLDETTGEKIRVENEQVTITADQIQQNADGTHSFTYSYYEQSEYAGYPLQTITCTIPQYDSTLTKGSVLEGYHNVFSWIFSTSEGKTGASFLGYTDEFPFFSFDIVLRQNTPAGIYNVNFSESGCRIRTAGGTYLPLKFMGTSIVVGAESATVSSDISETYGCFFAENDQPLTIAHMTDGTLNGRINRTPQAYALESAAVCGGSPASLYEAAQQPALIQDISFYCGDTNAPLYNANATPYTKKIMIGKKGDANLDGTISVEDAVSVLQYYAQHASGLKPVISESFTEDENILAYFLADIDTCSQNQGEDGGVLSVEDAVRILMGYAQNSADLPVTWDNRW